MRGAGRGGGRRGRGLRSPAGATGCALLVLVALLGLAAPLLTPYGPTEQLRGALLQPPSLDHPLGTDELSRDVLSRTLHGIRVNLLLVGVAVPAGALLGCLLAAVGMAARWADTAVQRLFDVAFAFPALVMALAVATAVGPGRTAVVLVIVATEAPACGRVLRARMLVVREADHVAAARVAGIGPVRTVTRHVLPNAIDPVVVQVALAMAMASALEGAMSFVGIGVRPPDPSLGALLADGLQWLDTRPALVAGPLLVVTLLVLGFTLVGTALNRGLRG